MYNIRREAMSPIRSLSKQIFKKLVSDAGGVLYLDARKANGYGLPNNSPLTSPFVDLSGYGNNATLTNFAGTTASGYDTSDIYRPFLRLDGTDDFMSLASTSILDITTNEFALCATFMIRSGATAGYIISRNLDAAVNNQYAIQYNSTNVVLLLNSSDARKTIAVSTDTWYNIIFYRDKTGEIKSYLNYIAQASATYADALVSQPNINIGARSSKADGTTRSTYGKIDLGTLTIYSAANLNVLDILRAEKAISKAYILR